MKRSESHSYMAYGKAKAFNRRKEALSCLIDYIEENGSEFNNAEQAEAIQLLGDVYFDLGKPELAKLLYAAGISIGSSSPTTRLCHAAFLGRKLKKPDEALSICNELIHALNEEEGPDDKSSREFYIAWALTLKEEFETIK